MVVVDITRSQIRRNYNSKSFCFTLTALDIKMIKKLLLICVKDCIEMNKLSALVIFSVGCP